MVLEINSNQPFGVQPNFFVNPMPRRNVAPIYVSFDDIPDYVSTSTNLDKYASVETISDMIKANPKIIRILDEANIPLRVNINTLNNLKKNHLPQTKKNSIGIVNNLPPNFRNAVDIKSIQKAAELHDLGKVLIPASILNKKGGLTDSELKIMQKHSQLSYEMLKTTDLDEETLYLIKHHHQNAQKTGYPNVEDNFVSDINLQILSVADMYSALKEKRSYKPALSKNEALAIIHKDVKQGKINPYVFKALVDYTNAVERNEIQKDIVNKFPVQGQFAKSVMLAKLNSQRQIKDGESPNRLSA